MKRTSFARFAAVLALAAVGSTSPGCGGGGGGDPAPCALPGTLVALALENAPAPDTGAGVFDAIPADVAVAAADGGWVAFVADVSFGTTGRGLFAAEPDGDVHLVFGIDEAVPSPGVGTIDVFKRVFVTPAGVIVALVEIDGASLKGILTARIDGTGAVVEKDAAVYVGAALPASPSSLVAGSLTAIEDDLMRVDDQGTAFFVGSSDGEGTQEGLYRVDRTGTTIESLAAMGDIPPLAPPPFQLTAGFDGLAIDADGVLIAYVCGELNSGDEAILVTNGTDTALVARDGDIAPGTGGRTYTDVSSGVLAVAEAFPDGVVFWQSALSGGAPNAGVFFKTVSPVAGVATALAVPGQVAPGAGPLASLTTIRLLEPQSDPSAITIEADITAGDTPRIYFSIPSPGSLNEVWRAGEIAIDAGGVATYGLIYPSMTPANRSDTDRFGSPAFTAVLSDATTGVWWAIRDCNFFKVALQGEAAPGTVGGTFASFLTPSTLTVAVDNLVFFAAVTGGANPTGIFRQH